MPLGLACDLPLSLKQRVAVKCGSRATPGDNTAVLLAWLGDAGREMLEQEGRPVDTSAVILALHGWSVVDTSRHSVDASVPRDRSTDEDGGRTAQCHKLLACEICGRRFFQHVKASQPASEDEQGERAPKKAKKAPPSPVEEHRWFCPWVRGSIVLSLTYR